MKTAVATAVELVQFPPESTRALGLFTALTAAAQGAGVEVVTTTQYRGGTPWLLLWGPGAPARRTVMDRHLLAGGHVLAWDLSYWSRNHKARVSFDAAHPWKWVMRSSLPALRFQSDPVPVENAWKPNGHVVVAGLGDKARVQYGPDVIDAWERAMIRDCRERWPTRPVMYRKKKIASPVPDRVEVASCGTPIETVLRGASLVVTWHSNVAVDAIRLGIPAICRDGAAAAVCPSTLEAEPTPLPVAVRERFLHNLAWFQWGTSPAECAAFWTFAQGMLS
jgi:hypothetical protein